MNHPVVAGTGEKHAKADHCEFILIKNHIEIFFVKINLLLFFELLFKKNKNTIVPA
jgi:hypothetical protein